MSIFSCTQFHRMGECFFPSFLKFPMVTGFPVEPMHTIDMGVLKNFMQRITLGVKISRVKGTKKNASSAAYTLKLLSASKLEILDERLLLQMKPTQIDAFQRRIRQVFVIKMNCVTIRVTRI